MRKRNCGFTSTALSAISIPASKPPSSRALRIELHRLAEVRFGYRPAVGPAHQRGENPTRHTASSSPGSFGSADENSAAAWRVSVALRIVRTGDRYLIERRRETRVPVHVVMRLVRLALRLEQRRGILEERHAELVRAGRHA